MLDEKYRCKFCKKFPDDPEYVRGLDDRGNATHYCKQGKSVGLVLGIIFWTIFAFFKISKLATFLLVPYILWVSFAGYLNLAIWLLN